MMTSTFSWLTVGNLDFLTMPGEGFPSFSYGAKQLMISKGVTNTIVTLGLTQDWMGYLMVDSQWDDSSLSYNQGLSPGIQVYGKYIDALTTVLSSN